MLEFLSTLINSSSTQKAYKEDLNDFSRWFEGYNSLDLKPALITAIDLREYQSHMLNIRGLKPATINRRLAAIRAWLKWSASAGGIQGLPRFPRGVSAPKLAPRALSKVEDARFLRTLARTGSHRDSALVAVMRFAGLRVGEATRIRVADIEIGARKGKVLVRSGKGVKQRTVPIGAEARSMIIPWLSMASSEWLFPGQTSHLSARAAQDMIKKYAYLAHIDKVTPHILRHTYATRLLRSGVDIVIVSTLLGHSRLDTTARYTEPEYADLEAAVERRG